MTREEAIEILQEEWDFCLEPAYVKNAIRLAITVLRGPTRAQVERMRGEWQPIERLWKYSHQWQCTKCGHPMLTDKKNFCENCGAPMTDEAVDMVMERLEALKDGKGD